MKAFWNLVAFDNMVRAVNGEGLSHYFMQRHRGTPALEWPLLHLCSDQGSDIVAAVRFLVGSAETACLLDHTPDINHLAWNSAKAALRESKLWRHCLQMVLHLVARFGPWKSGSRYEQCREMFEKYISSTTSCNCPVFGHFLLRLLGDRDAEHQLGSPGVQEEEWQAMIDREVWKVQGTPINLNRWFGLLRELRSEDAKWHSRALVQTLVCDELDLLKGDKVLKTWSKMVGASSATNSHPDKEPMRAKSVEERRLDRGAGNLLLTSTLILLDVDNQRRSRLIVEALEPLSHWQAEANLSLRSAGGAFKWSESQCQGAVLQMCSAIFSIFSNAGTLRHLRFLEVPSLLRAGQSQEERDGVIAEEDDWAADLGNLCMNSVAEILYRMLWLLRGWPGSSIKWLTGQDQQRKIGMQQFVMDHENFQQLRREQARTPSDVKSDLLRRSLWSTPIVEHLWLSFVESGKDMTPALAQQLASRHHRFLQSQLVEDGFSICREREKRSLNERPAVASLMAEMCRRPVIEGRHQFSHLKVADWSAQPPDIDARHFPAKTSESNQLLEAITSSKKPTWWTDHIGMMAAPIADLELVHWCQRSRGSYWKLLDSFWLSMLLNGENVVVRCSDAIEGYSCDQWFFPLGARLGSAVLLWPADEVPLGQPASLWHMAPRSAKQLCWAAMLDEKRWHAREFQWRSPVWQVTVGKLQISQARSIKAVLVDRKAKPLLSVAAVNAFWRLPTNSLQQLAQHLKVRLDEAPSLFQTCLALVRAVLGCTEAEAIDIVQKRGVAMENASRMQEQSINAVEEGLSLLEPQEQEEFQKEKRTMKADTDGVKDFARELALAKRRNTTGTKRQRKAKKTSLPPGEIPQDEAKKFLPAGASIWRDNLRHGWCGHFPPYKRVSARVDVFGTRGAVLEVLRALWRQALHHQGEDASNCGVEGLFDDACLTHEGVDEGD